MKFFMQNIIRQKYEYHHSLTMRVPFFNYEKFQASTTVKSNETHGSITQLQHQLMARPTVSVPQLSPALYDYCEVNPSQHII